MSNKKLQALAMASLAGAVFAASGAAFFLQKENHRRQERLTEARKEVQIRAHQLERELNRLVAAPGLLVEFLPPAAGKKEFEAVADTLIRLHGGLTAVQILAGDDTTTATYPASHGLRALPASINQALSIPALVPMAEPALLLEHDALLVRQPVSSAPGARWGNVNAWVSIAQLVAASRLSEMDEIDGYDYRVVLNAALGGGRTLLASGAAELSDPVSHAVTLGNRQDLLLLAVPRAGWGSRVEIVLELFLTSLAAFLVGLLTYRLLRQPELLRHEVTLRTEELAKVNASLKRQMKARAGMEDELRESHALLDSVLEHLPHLILVKRASDLRIVRANAYAEKMLALPREAIEGGTSEECMPAAAAASLQEAEMSALLEGRPVEIDEWVIENPAAERRVMHVKAIPLIEGGETTHVTTLFEDITERARLQAAISEQLHFLEQLIDAIPNAICYKDAQLRYLGCNLAFERLFGRPRSNVIGKTVLDIAAPELAEAYDQADRKLLAAPGLQAYEGSVRDGDGNLRDVLFYKATFEDRTGRPGGLVSVAVDVSERKNAERRITQLNRTLKVLGQTNSAIVRIRERKALLERACEILVEQGEFPLAWIYFASEVSAQPVIYAAKGIGVDFAGSMMSQASGSVRHQLPGTDVSCTQSLVCNTLCCCEPEFSRLAAGRGFASFAALPLHMGRRVIGGMAMFGSETGVFLEHDIALLQDVADNLSFALEALNQEERRVAAEKDLQLAARVFENSLEGIMITDAQNSILKVNKAFCSVTGYQPHEVIGQNPRILSSGTQDPAFYRDMWHSLRTEGEWHGEVRNRRKNGQTYPEWLTISVVKCDAGATTNYVAVFTDMTTRKRIEERLNFLAHYDVLTELPNRVLFVDRLEKSLIRASETGRQVAVMMLDLDRFKFINETFGHATGDLLLLEVSRRIGECLRPGDSASRLGGDQFAIVLPDVESPEALAPIVAHLLETIGSAYRLASHEAFISASIGVSLYPTDGIDVQTLLKNAESAMYRAMDEGGSRCRFYHLEMNARSSERMTLEANLRHALQRGELVLHYQPLIDGRTGLIVGAEALVRWMRPGVGLVSPSDFVPLLEETRQILPVGEWIIAKACEDNRLWRETTGEDLFVAVNFSVVQFEDAEELEFVDRMRQLLTGRNLDPRFLEIELTESAIIRNPEVASRALRQLKEMGIRLSIDDFGTGYSSLSYLRRFPFDCLKIDRSFIHDVVDDIEANAIIRAIIALGHSLKLRIVAEGVETETQAELLRGVRCDLLQGFRFSPAVSHDEFLRLAQSQPFVRRMAAISA